MAFIRFVGCSVGQKVCHACDTDFSRIRTELGGGMYSAAELTRWVVDANYYHVCLTGGEPLDRDLSELILDLTDNDVKVHIETSGTKLPAWFDKKNSQYYVQGFPADIWLAVSPKPGYIPAVVYLADEIKVILGGLGSGNGWPTVEDAVRWTRQGKLVYIQPRNGQLTVDAAHLQEALRVIHEHPDLRLSPQLHKFLATR